MRSFRLDPYLWVHLAGLAAVPLWLDICLLGLSTGSPALPIGIEIGFLSLVGVLPIFWMQWQKPFCIYSLLFLAVRPDRMSEDQRRVLRVLRDPVAKFLAAIAPLPLIWVVWKLFALAPLAADLSPFPNHGLGLVVAAIAFLLANLFVQVPLAVLRVLLVPERAFAKVPPYQAEQIKKDFTLIGLRVNRILPDWSGVAGQVQTEPPVESVSISPANPPATTPSIEEAWDDEAIPLNSSVGEVDEVDEVDEAVAPVQESPIEEVVPASDTNSPKIVATDALASVGTSDFESSEYKLFTDLASPSSDLAAESDQESPSAPEESESLPLETDSEPELAELVNAEQVPVEDFSEADVPLDLEQSAEPAHENVPEPEEAQSFSSETDTPIPMETNASETDAEAFLVDGVSSSSEPAVDPFPDNAPVVEENPASSSDPQPTDHSETSLQS
ncbi:MAG TPA: low-complexity tail membrane protein [Leptolyngbyaceae cyanobacterium]